MRLDGANLPALAHGCAVLGAGGGGDPELPLTLALRAVHEHGPVTLLDLAELDADAVVLPCGMIGSPTIAEERIWSGEEGRTLCAAVEGVRGATVDALMAFEIAGANGVLPVMWAARAGLPLVDADGMGRAFPQLHQQTMALAGIPPRPLALTDGRGNTLLLDPADDRWAERLARGALASLGGVCAGAIYCMSGEEARRATIGGSASLALLLGQAMETERVPARLQGICQILNGLVLIEGRIHDVERQSGAGFVRGSATVVGSGSDAGRRVRLEYQNEFLLVLEDGATCVAVPDLISVLSADSCAPVGVERLRQGQPVTVLASPAPEAWRSEEAIAIVGPSAFGYDVPFIPVADGMHRG
jgi:DUF917 family protein